MLWLTWHMWILLLLAFAGGVITGWVVRSRSDQPQRPRLSHSTATSRPEAEPASGTASKETASAGAVGGSTVSGASAPAGAAGQGSGDTAGGKDEAKAADRPASGASQPTPVPGAASSTATKPSSDTGGEPGDRAPDAKSAMAMTAPMQAPGADAVPVSDGPKSETSGGAGTPDGDSASGLTQIKGLGPKAAEKLNGAGITTVSQIANWSDADVERYDALINGRGRIARDDWVGQAKALAG